MDTSSGSLASCGPIESATRMLCGARNIGGRIVIRDQCAAGRVLPDSIASAALISVHQAPGHSLAAALGHNSSVHRRPGNEIACLERRTRFFAGMLCRQDDTITTEYCFLQGCAPGMPQPDSPRECSASPWRPLPPPAPTGRPPVLRLTPHLPYLRPVQSLPPAPVG